MLDYLVPFQVVLKHLFGKQKARGLDLILHRITVVLAVLFIILAVLVAYFEVLIEELCSKACTL